MGRDNGNSNTHIFKKLCPSLKKGEWDAALDILTSWQGPEIEETLKEPLLAGMLLWKGKMDAAAKMERYTASDWLITGWDDYVRQPGTRALPEQFLYAVKHFIYSTALKSLIELDRISGTADAEILHRIGRLRKGLGNYEQAVQALELANQQKKNDPAILADLADCYAQIDETRMAKLFFREALFLDPGRFDLEACESSFIHTLAAAARADGIPDRDIIFWLPVYGTLLGVFHVKRELKPVEIGKLIQATGRLEQSYQAEPSGRLKALLINKYFWLLDHYDHIRSPESGAHILEALGRLAPDIYGRYIH